MTLRWSEWQEPKEALDKDKSPYVDWIERRSPGLWDESRGIVIKDIQIPGAVQQLLQGAEALKAADLGPDLGGEGSAESHMAEIDTATPVFREIKAKYGNKVPLPDFSAPDKGHVPTGLPDLNLTDLPPEDAVIVGVIDSAIALSHDRFRKPGGKTTRILSAWLQGGKWEEPAGVAFGAEVSQARIDQEMAAATLGGAIDEALFNQRIGATILDHPRGDRRLERNASHGTLVADLAAGFDPDDPAETDHAARMPIIAVGLPSRESIGASGTYLELFAIHAIDYIVTRAERLWDQCGHEAGGGFPIVINLSYGLQAGPKDGTMLIEKTIAYLKERRGNLPFQVVLPAGNDNLLRSAAQFDLEYGQTDEILWRIRPEDRTSNYAELWSDVIEVDPAKPLDPSHRFAISVTPPGVSRSGPGSAGQPGQFCELVDHKAPDYPLARIYCRAHDDIPLDKDRKILKRFSYVVCTAPSLSYENVAAPAGEWRISFAPVRKIEGEPRQRALLYVQSDQSLTLRGNSGLESYFDHPDYEVYDPVTGRLVDSYNYPLDGAPPTETDTAAPLRRHNTLNAIASLAAPSVMGVLTIAGHRISDGKPAVFSSTGRGFPRGGGGSAPTASMPSDDGPARFGVLGAGSKSGSVVAMQGTSFSTAMATRRVALALLDWIDGGRPEDGTGIGTAAWLKTLAEQEEQAQRFAGKIVPEKSGAGRLKPVKLRHPIR
jgi:hypothetical protein